MVIQKVSSLPQWKVNQRVYGGDEEGRTMKRKLGWVNYRRWAGVGAGAYRFSEGYFYWVGKRVALYVK
jgi:hypothetical protein